MNFLTFSKRTFVEENGATSVLVIFLMIVLVTLGAFAITSSNVNYKFSRKALDWNRMYYALDSTAEEYVMAVDAKLAQAEAAAVAYIGKGGFNQVSAAEVPQSIQSHIYQVFQNSPSKELAISQALNQVYMYYANKNLGELALEYPDNKVFPLMNNDRVDGIVMEINFKSQDVSGYDTNLKVSLRVNPADYTISYRNNQASGLRNTVAVRYKIEGWYEWQTPPEVDDTQIIWDGR